MTNHKYQRWLPIHAVIVLGAKHRRLQSRLGAPKAITAMAHHLARLLYRMIKYGSQYVDHGVAAYEARFKEQRLAWLSRKAAELHLCLAPLPNLAG